MLLADIATGDTATGDVLFLIAAILFGLAALAQFLAPAGSPEAPRATYWGWTPAFVSAGLCLTAIGLLVQ